MELLLYLIKEIIKLLMICGSTYVVSFFMLFVMVGKLFKILADNGYKINMEKLKKHSSNNSIASKLVTLIYIPFINIIFSMIITLKTIQEIDAVLNSFDIMDGIEELTEKEMEEYQKNPNMFNALIQNVMSNKNLDEKEHKIENKTDLDEVIENGIKSNSEFLEEMLMEGNSFFEIDDYDTSIDRVDVKKRVLRKDEDNNK